MCNAMTDLAVLGCVQNSPKRFSQVISAVQSIVPDLWSPTSSVITDAFERGVWSADLIVDGEATDPIISISKKGRNHFNKLMLLDPERCCASIAMSFEQVQLRYVDVAEAQTRETVLVRMKWRVSRRLRGVETKCRECELAGLVPDLWIRMEEMRLRGMAALLMQATQMKKAGMSVSKAAE